MEVATITRKFMYHTGNKDVLELDDFNEGLSNDQIMDHYSQIYAELTNANIRDMGIVNGYHEIQFRTLAGTKG